MPTMAHAGGTRLNLAAVRVYSTLLNFADRRVQNLNASRRPHLGQDMSTRSTMPRAKRSPESGSKAPTLTNWNTASHMRVVAAMSASAEPHRYGFATRRFVAAKHGTGNAYRSRAGALDSATVAAHRHDDGSF